MQLAAMAAPISCLSYDYPPLGAFKMKMVSPPSSMGSEQSTPSQLTPLIDLLKSIWEDKNGNWCNLDRENEGKLSEIIATKDFRLHAIEILDAFSNNKNNYDVAAAVQVIIYTILKDLKAGDKEGDELENWVQVPYYSTIVDYIFTLLPWIKSHLLTSFGPNLLPDKRSIFYESIVATLATFIIRSKTCHFPKFESTILKYIESIEIFQAAMAMDIWVLLLRGNSNLRRVHTLYLVKKLLSAKSDQATRLAFFIRRGYYYCDDEAKDELKPVLVPLKNKLPWILDELTAQERKAELMKILPKCKPGSKVDILDIRCASYILASENEFFRESEEVKKIVPYIFYMKKNLIQKRCTEKTLRKLVNESFLKVAKFLSIKSLDDLLSFYLAQQAKDDLNVITEGSLLDEVDEQIFIAKVFHSNASRISKSQFGAEPIIDKSLQLRCSSCVAESIWMDFWCIFCKFVPWPNLIRKYFSYDSRSTPFPFDKRRAFYEYLGEVPVLDEKEMFDRLTEFFIDSIPNGSLRVAEITRETDVRTKAFTSAGQEYEPPVKKKKILCLGSNGMLTAEPLDDLVNQNLIRLRESLTFLFEANSLPDKAQPAVFQSREMIDSIVAKHWPDRGNDAPKSSPKDNKSVIEID